MLLLPSDYIFGFVGLEGPAPEDSEHTTMTVLVACLRREARWLVQFEFLYTSGGGRFSADDDRSGTIIEIPPFPEEELSRVLRQGAEMMASIDGSLRGAKVHELIVRGTMDKVPLVLQTASPELQSLFGFLRCGPMS